ncbi:hypothetical protein KC717_02825 [Candidatus Dojkabacteria bacterium]|uniref:Uncharacterized protein n=1 Tax=Candidatus Dojkabacteria bacterium TaxID=2099670 RepID=A0A955RKK7_9BACT|nr:hypothetical protein [Candidatus Dojkabacteria bacterium]
MRFSINPIQLNQENFPVQEYVPNNNPPAEVLTKLAGYYISGFNVLANGDNYLYVYRPLNIEFDNKGGYPLALWRINNKAPQVLSICNIHTTSNTEGKKYLEIDQFQNATFPSHQKTGSNESMQFHQESLGFFSYKSTFIHICEQILLAAHELDHSLVATRIPINLGYDLRRVNSAIDSPQSRLYLSVQKNNPGVEITSEMIYDYLALKRRAFFQRLGYKMVDKHLQKPISHIEKNMNVRNLINITNSR